MYRCVLGLVLSLLVCCSSTAMAQNATSWPASKQKESASEDSKLSDSGFELRWWGATRDMPNFDNAEPETHRAVYQRLRGVLDYQHRNFQLRASADLLTGRLAGDPWPESPPLALSRTRTTGKITESTYNNIVMPRTLYAGYKTSIGLIRAGLQTSHWGLGLLANDGGRDHEKLFGQSNGGDANLRVLFATSPFINSGDLGKHIFVALGGDYLWRDDLGSRPAGDQAYQGILSAFYRHQDAFLGAYSVYRTQEYRDGSQLDVLALDMAGYNTWDFAEGKWQLKLGAELAWFNGSTDRALPELDVDEQRLDVQALGFAFEGSVRHVATDTAIHLLAGYASGDASSQDDTLYRFRFDPNYRVGLILFESYIPAMTRTYLRQASDPDRSAQARRGLDGLVADGGVENALYLNPQLIFGSEDGLMAGVALLWAYAAVPPAAPYQTLENGGTPSGVRGASPVSRDLGVEVDIATQYRMALVSNLFLELKGEFGILFPGKAFDDELGQSAPPQNLIRGRVSLSW